jgi:hypothetical protein
LVDVYLTGTVMLIFGMGLYGLFISNIPNNLPPNEDRALRNSSLFGMFLLRVKQKENTSLFYGKLHVDMVNVLCEFEPFV